MIRPPRSAAFTLIEMITVISIIVILVSLVLAVNGLVQRKAAASKAAAEIQLLTQACEAYKTDNGGYPQDNSSTTQSTNILDPTISTTPTSQTYYNACSFLYASLSGDTNANGVIDANEKTNTNYAADFFKQSRMAGGASTGTPMYIMDPYGNCYGYSTAALLAEQEYQAALATTAGAQLLTNGSGNPRNSLGFCGYNTTFDLWSTAGTTSGSPSDLAKWVKNW